MGYRSGSVGALPEFPVLDTYIQDFLCNSLCFRHFLCALTPQVQMRYLGRMRLKNKPNEEEVG